MSASFLGQLDLARGHQAPEPYGASRAVIMKSLSNELDGPVHYRGIAGRLQL
jgi:hypothetical protein